MFTSLGQLVMLAPASPRTLALIPPSNQALNQMVSQPFIVNLVYNSRTSCHHPQEDLLLLLLGAAVQSEQKQVKYNQLKDHENNTFTLHIAQFDNETNFRT